MKKKIRQKTYQQQIAAKIREIRVKKGLTQKQLADRVGSSDTYIATIESGTQNPTFAMLTSIFYELDVDISKHIKNI